jgi:hypothetical protein
MISKKRRHKGLIHSPPTTGRAAFRGILHPLILGGQSIAPSSTATTSNFDPYSSATVTQPDKDPQPTSTQTACELPLVEQEYCDVNPTFSWCKKRKLKSDDPKCVPNNIKCPPSEKWLSMWYDDDVVHNPYRDFLKEENIINGINGQCIDEASAENEKKKKEAYEDWINTRGCKLGYNHFGHEVVQNYARCPDEFKDAKLGDIRNIDREDSSGNTQDFDMKLIQWIPDKPAYVNPYDDD